MVTILDSGMLLGRYRLGERIAQGGMGSVWCAHDEQLDRDVAIKVLPRILASDPSAERRFYREARAMGRLQHPNVVSVYDIGSADPGQGEEVPYLVMELITGSSLDQLLTDGPLDELRAGRIMEQVCRALSAAHNAGVIHRDLKPSNIMVSDEDHVKVLDFGLARLNQKEGQAPEETLTTPGMVLGSCPYMAPEQALGQQVGPESDIFSCGSVLYEALTGKRAFAGPTPMRVLQAVVKCEYEQLQSSDELSEGMIEAVDRCLRPKPEDRFHSCLELARALTQVCRSSSMSHAHMVSTSLSSDQYQALRTPRPWERWAIGVGLLLTGGVIGALIGQLLS